MCNFTKLNIIWDFTHYVELSDMSHILKYHVLKQGHNSKFMNFWNTYLFTSNTYKVYMTEQKIDYSLICPIYNVWIQYYIKGKCLK